LPVRGLVRTRIWDHLKVIAYNFKSYYSYCKRTGASPLSFQHFSARTAAVSVFVRRWRVTDNQKR
jgi:hypothetical protein